MPEHFFVVDHTVKVQVKNDVRTARSRCREIWGMLALEAKKHAYDVLGKQNGGGLSGVGDEQFFREKVEALTRLYNTRMNPPLPPAPEPYHRNEYERQSRG